MADVKISIRFFNDTPVRSVWDVATAAWWMCATDVVWVLAETRNPRIYWATVKRRIPAGDGKRYLTDVIDDRALDALLAVIRSPTCASGLTGCSKRILLDASIGAGWIKKRIWKQ